jgi:hypothetical protein
MGKLLKNHWTSHIERQTDEAEHKMLICHFRLGTQCVSLRRDRRYYAISLLAVPTQILVPALILVTAPVLVPALILVQ